MFWADEGLGATFWEHLTLQGLFASNKALIIRQAQNLPQDTLKELSPLLPRAGSLVWPILCFEVPLDKGKPKIASYQQKLPFYENAQKHGWIVQVPPLNRQTLPRFVSRECVRHGLQVSPQETERLAMLLPQDGLAAGSEIAKLALAAQADGTLPEGYQQLIDHEQELNIFEILREVQINTNIPAVWKQVLENQLGSDKMIFGFIAILLREARLLWQLLAGESVYLPPQAIGAKKLLARSLGFSGIAKIWELALQADKGIQTGERNPDQALEALLGDLYLLFHKRFV